MSSAHHSFDELIGESDPRVMEIARRLRRLIFDVHPAAVEVVRLGDRAASFGIGPKKMSEAHSFIMPMNGYVNVGLYFGTSLTDADRLLQGTGTSMRHVKVRSLADADRPALRRLIEAAVEERRRALGGL